MNHQPAHPILVVALHRVQPDRDNGTSWAFNESVRLYRQDLERISTEPLDPRYYDPRRALMFGIYDSATFYLADDLESVVYMASAGGATAQEMLYGAVLPPPGPDYDADIGALLTDEPDPDRAVLGVVCIKLTDAIATASGHALETATAAMVYERARVRGCHCVVLDAYSWPELVVVISGPTAHAVASVAADIESIQVHHLPEVYGRLREALRSSGDDSPLYVPRGIIRRWIADRRLQTGGLANPTGFTADALDQLLGVSHVVVAARAYTGLHAAGLLGWLGDGEAHRATTEVCRAVCNPTHDDDAEDHDRAAFIDDLGGRVEEAFSHAEEGSDRVRALIQWLPKPGHADEVRDVVQLFADRLMEAHGDTRADVSDASGPLGTTIALRCEVPDGRRGFVVLVALACWSRAHLEHARHVLDVTSLLGRTPTTGLEQRKAGPRGRRYGYSTLSHNQAPSQARFERDRLSARSIGRIEALALRGWLNALADTLSLPDMFGSVVDLADLAAGVRRVVFYPDTKGYAAPELPTLVGEVTEYGQHALEQRVQFSPLMGGVPPLSGEVPVGTNQLIGVVTNVASAIFALDERTWATRRRAEGVPRPKSAAMTAFFSADAAIETRGLGRIPVLRLSQLQAMNPLTLTVLFHEHGHWLLRCWLSPDAHRDTRASFDACAREIGAFGAADHRHAWLDRQRALFLEDIFAHAVWRRAGATSWRRFELQFLLGQAMGLRRAEGIVSAADRALVWAETTLHLLIQRQLHDLDNPPFGPRIVALVGRRLGQGVFDEMLERVWRYCEHEVGDDQAQLRALLEGHYLSPLCRWVGSKSDALADFNDRCDGLFKKLDTLVSDLEAEEKLLASKSTDYDTLDPHLSAGMEPAAPWSVLAGRELEPDAEPERLRELAASARPSQHAYLWIRKVLSHITDRFGELLPSTGPIGVRRGPENTIPTLEPGAYTNHLGGVFVIGETHRETWLSLRVSTLRVLADVALRIRAGRVLRYLSRERAYPRFRGVECSFDLEIDGTCAAAFAVDITPDGGLGGRLAEGHPRLPPVEQSAGATRPEITIHAGSRRLHGLLCWTEPEDRTFGAKIEGLEYEDRSQWPPTWLAPTEPEA